MPFPVFQDEVLVSEKRPTFQSTTAYGAFSSRAVDRDAGSCTHTGYGYSKSFENSKDPWWVVDLGARRKITRILITNRKDCCGDRLSDFEIRIGDAIPLGNGRGNSATRNRICQSGLSVPEGITKEFRCPMVGRYIVIRIPGENKVLTLCDVKVYAEGNPKKYISCPQCQLRRFCVHLDTCLDLQPFFVLLIENNSIRPVEEKILSAFKPTFQSSTLWSAVSGKATDGNRNGVFSKGSCTHTGMGPGKKRTSNPWWAVDLGSAQKISSIRITTRSDCCSDWLDNFEIRVGKWRPQGLGNQNSACQHNLKIPRGETYQFDCPTYGRYVTIRVPGREKFLTLCEVEVLGKNCDWALVMISSVAMIEIQFGTSLYCGNSNCSIIIVLMLLWKLLASTPVVYWVYMMSCCTAGWAFEELNPEDLLLFWNSHWDQ